MGGRETFDYEQGSDVGMMRDRDISVTMAAAVLLWVAGAVLLGLSLVVDHRLGVIGLYATGWAMLLSNRWMMCNQERRVREAFEMGREWERSTGSLHALR